MEMAELKNDVLEAHRKISELEGVIDRQSTIIKENTALLIKQRLPPRPFLNPTAKALIAQQQNWMCCNPEARRRLEHMIIIVNTPRSPCAGSWLANLVDVVHFLTFAFFTYQKKACQPRSKTLRCACVAFTSAQCTDMPTEERGTKRGRAMVKKTKPN